ncbi:MAG: response regulator [Cyanobacteria bacterium]|nr:response regulator [Cyanobacteriota bacterium]
MNTEIQILVAGASTENVTLAKSALERLGYQIIPANEMTLALFLAQKNYPDLIISDSTFRLGDGMSFLKELKLDDELSPIPFLFLISENQPFDEADAIASGALQVLRHPIAEDELANLVDPLIIFYRQVKRVREDQTPE